MERWQCLKCGFESSGAGLSLTIDAKYRSGHCRVCRRSTTFRAMSGPGFAHFTADDTAETVESKMADAFAPVRAMREALADHGQARASDPATAQAAARLVRPGSARARLLKAHLEQPDGLTDEEAATLAGLPLTSEYATRCSELMRAGLLVSASFARTGASGMARQVRRTTPLARELFA